MDGADRVRDLRRHRAFSAVGGTIDLSFVWRHDIGDGSAEGDASVSIHSMVHLPRHALRDRSGARPGNHPDRAHGWLRSRPGILSHHPHRGRRVLCALRCDGGTASADRLNHGQPGVSCSRDHRLQDKPVADRGRTDRPWRIRFLPWAARQQSRRSSVVASLLYDDRRRTRGLACVATPQRTSRTPGLSCARPVAGTPVPHQPCPPNTMCANACRGRCRGTSRVSRHFGEVRVQGCVVLRRFKYPHVTTRLGLKSEVRLSGTWPSTAVSSIWRRCSRAPV